MGMLLVQALLLPWVFFHWANSIDPHAFTMLFLSHFPNNSSVEFIGNATLDGKLTHSLEAHNTQFNVSQLVLLDTSDIWKQRESNLHQFLQKFEALVNLFARERKVPYPIHVTCTTGCFLLKNGTANSFYRVVLNGTDFLRFHTATASWVHLQDSPLASYVTRELNKYDETTSSIQFFLQKTCIHFLREHTDLEKASTGEHRRGGRSYIPLVLGITLGAFALIGLAICIILFTGGNR